MGDKLVAICSQENLHITEEVRALASRRLGRTDRHQQLEKAPQPLTLASLFNNICAGTQNGGEHIGR